MKPADDLTDFALESMFTKARKTRDLATALRHVFAELDASRCSHIPAAVVAVLNEVGPRFNTTRDVLLGRDGNYLHARPRALAWWLLHFRFDQMSYPAIGKVFEGRHHTTILKRVADITSLMVVDDDLAAMLDGIEAAVRGRMAERAAA